MSATSLKLLLRDPIRFAWRYALGWKQPDSVDEPLTLDALSFGNLVHGVLEQAVNFLEANGGFACAGQTRIETAVSKATAKVAHTWEREQPTPPPVIWRNTLQRAQQLALAALSHPLEFLPGQKSWTEIPFGMRDAASRNDLPWDPTRKVEIPGAGVFIQGHIDRLDLSGDGSRARVIDYKTGKPKAKMAEIVIDGGERTPTLSLCLRGQDACSTTTSKSTPRFSIRWRTDGDQALFPLQDVDATLEQLADAIALARLNIEAGLALPGIDAENVYNDFAFALPANAG